MQLLSPILTRPFSACRALIILMTLSMAGAVGCSSDPVDSGFHDNHDGGDASSNDPDAADSPGEGDGGLGDDRDAQTPGPNPDGGPSDEHQLSLSQTEIYVARAANEQQIEVQSSGAWAATSDAHWIELVDGASGGAGTTQVTLAIDENQDDGRVGHVDFSVNEQAPVRLKVVQENGGRAHIYVTVDGNGEGYSWEDPTTLDAALTLAESGHTIHLAEGTYTPTRAVSGGSDSSAGDKTFEIAHNITLIGGYAPGAQYDAQPDPAAHQTVLSGAHSANHVLTVHAPATNGEKLSIQGVVISDGKNRDSQSDSRQIDGVDFPQNVGAGIIASGSTIELIDTEIVNNQAGRAPAIYGFNGVSLTLKRAKINHNTAEALGGAIWARDGASLKIRDSQVRDNESGAIAGAIYVYDNSSLEAYNSVIADNIAKNHGGGLYIRQNSRATLVNVVVSNNSITSGTGAGVFIFDDSSLNIVSSTITHNYSFGEAGGVYLRNGANSLKVYNSIIAGNAQAVGSKQLDRAADDQSNPEFHSSIIQKTTYGANGQEVSTDFNPNAELIYLKWGFFGVKSGGSKAAEAQGMQAAELADLSSSLAPAPPEDILTGDFFGQSRQSQALMGALLNQDESGVPSEEIFFPELEKVRVLKRFDFISRTYYFLTRVRKKDHEGNFLKLRHAQANSDAGETVPEFAARMGNPLVAINASMGIGGTPSGVTLPSGIQIVDGTIIQDLPRTQRRHTLGIKDDNELVAYPPDSVAQEVLDDGTNNALNAFTTLIDNHQPVEANVMTWVGNYAVKHPRQVIAQDDNLDVVILSCGGRSYGGEGMLAEDVIRVLSEQDVKYAHMLDGGGSTSTVVNGKLITKRIDGSGTKDRARPNFLYVSE